MAENLGQTSSLPPTEVARTARRTQKRLDVPQTACDSRAELRKQVKQAAADDFLKLGVQDQMQISDLLAQHRVTNTKADRRAVSSPCG